MQNSIFKGVFDTTTTTTIALNDFLLCLGVALALGLVLALGYTYKSRYTKSFVVTLAIIPAVVCVVIMLVNGNVGTGVAVAGAFSLVRFRSVPGTAKEIGAIFLAMGAGLATGMGYLAFAALFTLILIAVTLLYQSLGLGAKGSTALEKIMRITIPEDLDYSGVFDDLFEAYTTYCEVVNVKTTNMGSLFNLTYNLTLKEASKEKEFIDQLRCRNGNLEISISRQEMNTCEL
ncbi:DUF4956 domain-containing protein [Pygmaiobacter massiliensis]|uniref:DUF4956 domain-containing protein n=1 Tax=Pygmaiobacter massiliensis TaxID=1917873 RepID=UPI002A82BB40|nr:DUF4956 domain-containing protein [Pygmaiobacter massiliensis]MDY4783602.1 DUF4956 domain-containing protein [Pygmaiobacter massiliensis]